MLRNIFLILSLFTIPVPVLVLMSPLLAHSNPADSEEVAHMKAGHHKVEGMVSEVKSGRAVAEESLKNEDDREDMHDELGVA